MYCATAGLTEPTGECKAGFYCGEGSTTDEVSGQYCTALTYCPPGAANVVICPTGFYSDVTTLTWCKTCLPGTYCKGGDKQDCPAGYYCP